MPELYPVHQTDTPPILTVVMCAGIQDHEELTSLLEGRQGWEGARPSPLAEAVGRPHAQSSKRPSPPCARTLRGLAATRWRGWRRRRRGWASGAAGGWLSSSRLPLRLRGVPVNLHHLYRRHLHAQLTPVSKLGYRLSVWLLELTSEGKVRLVLRVPAVMGAYRRKLPHTLCRSRRSFCRLRAVGVRTDWRPLAGGGGARSWDALACCRLGGAAGLRCLQHHICRSAALQNRWRDAQVKDQGHWILLM